MTATITKFKKYEAQISLGFIEGLAPNHVIAEKLQQAGFTNVIVEGSGASRRATGVWKGETQNVDLPQQIKCIKEL